MPFDEMKRRSGAFERAMSLGWISKDVSREAFEGSLSHFDQTFYRIAQPEQEARSKQSIRLERKGERISKSIKSWDGNIEVVLLR